MKHRGVVQLANSLWDLAVGRRCLTCDRVGPPWCDRCLRSVVDIHTRQTPGGARVVAAARYSGSVRTAVVAYKEHGHLALAVPLGRLLAGALAPGRPSAFGARTAIVPIPSTRAATRMRGNDHACRLARQAGALSGVSAMKALRWASPINDQAGLSASERRLNVAGAMVAKPPRATSSVALVVDDIMTTGATLDEGTRALTSAGWVVASVSVVAGVDDRRALAPRDPLR